MHQFLKNYFRRDQENKRLQEPAVATQRLFFLHLPKCGGTSLDAALRRIYKSSGHSVVHLDAPASKFAAELLQETMHGFRTRLLLYHMAVQRNRYISGHFVYSDIAWKVFSAEWHFMTILRDPVARWYSHYFFNRDKPGQDHFRISEPLEVYIESPQARSLGSSYVSALMSADDSDSDDAIDRAVDNLQRFPVVGLLEHMNVLTADCERLLGITLPIEHHNKNPRTAEEQQREITPQIDARVRELCEPNRRIYDAVLSRIKEYGSWHRT
ncbi:MAG: sulfotransferase family 2 domain-containing protein [Burkholderiales bacterium]|nr:sulfotransferase family 2 domain-containing protein [Burkholderiales bacterium]